MSERGGLNVPDVSKVFAGDIDAVSGKVSAQVSSICENGITFATL